MQQASQSQCSNTNPATPIALTIAGSDSSGGAGIQADLKTFSALGAYGASVITALTAQNTQAVTAIHDIPADFVAEQLRVVLDDLDVNAIKIGMLSSVAIIETVSTVLTEYKHIPVVLDPVMVAKSGDFLLQPDAVDALVTHLCSQATVLTPNIPEAARLIGTQEAVSLVGMQEHAQQLNTMTSGYILLKGGHLDGSMSTDLLCKDGETHHFEFPRIDTQNTHGTGCTLSSAIAAGLSKGLSVIDAITQAEQYVHEAIAAADDLPIGRGHGPVHHFHAHWNTAV